MPGERHCEVSVEPRGLVLPAVHRCRAGGTLLMAVLVSFTRAGEQSLLKRGEKRVGLNGVRSGSLPAHPPLLHNLPLAWEGRSRSAPLRGG